MKKAYVKPSMESEAFVPDGYVSACEYTSSYKGKCDTSGHIFVDTNGNGQYDPGVDKYKYDNTACDQFFESATMPEYNAFAFSRMKLNNNGTPLWLLDDYWEGVGTPIRVYNFDDTHANHNLDKEIHHNVS